MWYMSHTIGLLTVVYQNYDVLQDLLNSLSKQTDTDYHLYIADLSAKRQQIDGKNIPVTVIESENKGYAHGVNVAMEKAMSDDITSYCILNDDTYFEKDFVSHVKMSMRTHRGAIIGGKIYYAPGYEYHKDRYTKKDRGRVLWYAGGITDWNHVITRHIGVDEVDTGQFDTLTETDFITGCLMCYDREVADKIGLWSTEYFMYYEDADLCERAHRAGVKLLYDPSIVIWHKSGQSTEGSGSKLQYTFQTRNRLRFGLKYAPIRTKLHLLKNHFLGTK